MKYKTLFALISIALLLAACASPTPEPTPTHTPTPETEADLAAQIATWDAESTELAAATLPPTEAPTETPTLLPTDVPTPTPSPDDWMHAPIIPQSLSQAAIDIYLHGLELGRDPHAFSKVGDCGGTPSWFLGAFDLNLEIQEYYRLGEYETLTTVIGHFPGSFERYSMAVSPGFNTSSIFSPLWADTEFCERDEGPLQCEFRVHNPSIALVMLGTNDYVRPEEFEENMRRLIEYGIEQGVLMVLSSKADNLEGDHAINRTIYELALEYELPYWNFWAAADPLPAHGLQEDGAHLTWAPNFFDDERVMRSGWPWRNLTALQALDALLQSLTTP